MKNIFIILLSIIISTNNINAQKPNIDSINNVKNIERIRKNVTEFLEKQNKRFSEKLSGFNEEFITYFKPNYGEKGFLISNLDNLNYQIKGNYDYEIESCGEFNLSLPQKIVDYSNFLLFKTNGNWCENKFGYKNLKRDDDFGILFIYSPKNIPDSLSILKLKEFTFGENESQTKEKKRMNDLAILQLKYIRMAEGLNERFIRVVLKY